MKEKLSDMIQDAVGGCAKYWADVIAEKLVANGVTILPEGAMILTRAELDAMNKHNEKVKREQASEVAEEIFAEIEKCSEVALMNGHIETPILCIGFGVLAELKKKYIGEDINVRTNTEEGK